MNQDSHMIRLLKAVENACAWFGKAAAWTVPVLVLGTCITVLMVQLRVNTLLEWAAPIPLFVDRLTLGGLTDLQWHLFAVMTMLGGVYALHDNAHVCVDFLASNFTERTRAIITMLGDLFLLLPFALIMTNFAWDYTVSAYLSGEGSSYGGLADRWLIKAVMPLGFGLLAVFGFTRGLRLLLELLGGSYTRVNKEAA
jgi:TRAP-type mannitol/chloroaromatic compound transport system permease small subunit